MSLDAAAAEAGYTLVNLAARGERSSVYRADDAAADRVALRVFGADVSVDMIRERVDALAAVEHPNVLRVRDVLVLDGEPAVVTDWFDGIPLDDALSGPEAMPEVRAERVARHILEGVRALHAANIAHGALSEHNILVDGDDIVLVDLALGADTAAVPATDLRDVAPILRSLFARTDVPEWRSQAIDAASRGEGPADAAGLIDAVLPSRRERTRRERVETEERPPVLMMIAVGLGAVLVTLGAFLWLGPDEDPLPGPTITGEETETGS